MCISGTFRTGELAVKVCSKCYTESPNETRFCPNCGALLPNSDAPVQKSSLIGKTVAGNFLVQELVGAGAMGSIYKAEQITLGKTVCIKVLHDHLTGDPTLSKRFHREARAASRLKHPNAISIIDFGTTEDGVHYIAMDFVDGTDLSHVIKKEFPLDPMRILDILNQIASALDEAHAQGIIHRDLKPENIMMEDRRHQRDFVTVLDFGIAKIKDPDRESPETFATMAGIVCGTPEYMSPEQAKGESLDSRTDLYSLGVILYQLNTGKLPFTADTPIGVVTKHLTQDPPRPREVNPNIHEAMEVLILGLMAKNRGERPSSAMEVKRLIEKVRKEISHTDNDALSRTAPMSRPSAEELKKGTPSSASADESQVIESTDQDETFVVPRSGIPAAVKWILLVLVLAGGAVGTYFGLGLSGTSGSGDITADSFVADVHVAAASVDLASEATNEATEDVVSRMEVVAVVDAVMTPEEKEAESQRRLEEERKKQERNQLLYAYVGKLSAFQVRYKEMARRLTERRSRWQAVATSKETTQALATMDSLQEEVADGLNQVSALHKEVTGLDSSTPLAENLDQRIAGQEEALVSVEEKVRTILAMPVPQEPTENPLETAVTELTQRVKDTREELRARSALLESKAEAWEKARVPKKSSRIKKYVEDVTVLDARLAELTDQLNTGNVLERRDSYNKSLGQTEAFFAEVQEALDEKVVAAQVVTDAQREAWLKKKKEQEARRKAEEEKKLEEEKKRQAALAKKAEDEKKRKLTLERKEKGREAERSGDKSRTSGDYPRAILYYKEALNLAPSAGLHKKLGQAYNSKGDYANGAKHLRTYLRLMDGKLSPIKVQLIQKQIRD